MPSARVTSATGAPASTSRKAVAMCSSENRLFFIARPPTVRGLPGSRLLQFSLAQFCGRASGFFGLIRGIAFPPYVTSALGVSSPNKLGALFLIQPRIILDSPRSSLCKAAHCHPINGTWPSACLVLRFRGSVQAGLRIAVVVNAP